jgi:hypothetical protein
MFEVDLPHGHVAGVVTVIGCGVALPAPTVIVAGLEPTIPFPRVTVMTLFVTDTTSAVVELLEVPTDAVTVGATAPGLVIVAST